VFLKREPARSAEVLLALLHKMTASPGTTQDLDKLCREILQITSDWRNLASASKPLCRIFMKFFGIGRRSRAIFEKIGAVIVKLHVKGVNEFLSLISVFLERF
jgi:hypothetical protein